MYLSLSRLWRHIQKKNRVQLILLLALMVLASFAEVISIGAVLPFMSALVGANFETDGQGLLGWFLVEFDFKSGDNFLVGIGVIFVGLIFFAASIRLLLQWSQVRISNAIGTQFSLCVYENALYQPYGEHLIMNSSEIQAGVDKAYNLSHYIIQPVITIISALLISAAIVIALLMTNTFVAISTILGFVIMYGSIIFLTKKKLVSNSKIISSKLVESKKVVQEGLASIRDILIDGTQSVYRDIFSKTIVPLYQSIGSNQIIGNLPRYIVEPIGIALIVLITFLVATDKSDISSVLPTLGALALGAQRLIPLLQNLYHSYSQIKGNESSIKDALDFLDKSAFVPRVSQCKALLFEKSINIKNLGFKYPGTEKLIISNLSLRIPKGVRVGIIGTTGSGKSTFLDILMALLVPTHGTICIDDVALTDDNRRAWQSEIAHVPQSVYLSDATVFENIAFGVPFDQIDFERVKKAARDACISDFVEGLPAGYLTLVGERGVRFSGGQRQRIGIARALYKNANVIIFDEATSALDSKTESDVMASIQSLSKDLTLIIVAHRLSTLTGCDLVYELPTGTLHAG